MESSLVEPPATVCSFSASSSDCHYSWRGAGPGEKATSIGVFDPQTEQWTLQPTTGPPPSGISDGRCTIIGTHLFCFGGASQINDLYKLDLDTFVWSEVHPSNDPSEWPMGKQGYGMVAVNDKTLCCFGGYGKGEGPSQLGSTFTFHKDGEGWTNEFHLFDIEEGMHDKLLRVHVDILVSIVS